MKLDFISHTLSYKLQPSIAKKHIEHIYRRISNKTAYKELKDEYQTALNMAKALEYNSEFEKFMQWYRENRRGLFKLEPYTREDAFKLMTLVPPPEIIKRTYDSRIILAVTNSKYTVHKELLKQIPFIYAYNAIFLPLIQPDIKIITDVEMDKLTSKNNDVYVEERYNTINIQISSNISAGAIVEFVKKHTYTFRNKTKVLTREDFYISKKDLEIIELRKGGSSFRSIADIMDKKYYYTGIKKKPHTENSVDKAYNRAMDTINLLFNHKKITELSGKRKRKVQKRTKN